MANALNIVGENHKEYVSNQITTRQRVLNQRREANSNDEVGYQYRNSSNLSYINSRTAYLRIASSVDIRESNVYRSVLTSEDRIKDGGYELRRRLYGLTPEGTYIGGGENSLGTTYNYLAASLVLFGGSSVAHTSRISSFTNFRWAIDTLGASSRNIDTTFLNQGSNNFYDLSVVSVDTSPSDPYNYGYGGSEFGLVPAPGIISFRTSNLNKGATRISTIELRANNKRQFEWIEALYLRLGYTVFVEWGDSSYYITDKANDDVKYITGIDAFNSLLGKFLWNDLEPGDSTISEREQRIQDFWEGIYRQEEETDYHNLNLFYQAIEKLREESEGNYDALLGRVRNFNWEFTTEGYYKITLELVSYGDVVESLKINNFTYSTDLEEFEASQRESVKSDLEAFIITAADFYPFVNNPNDSPSDWVYSTSYKNYPSLKNPTEPVEQREVVDRLAGYTRPEREWDKTVAIQAHIDDSPTLNPNTPPSNLTPEEYEYWRYEQMSSTAKVYQYVRLKDILDFINERCLLYDSKDKKIIRIEIPDETPDENGNPKEQCIGYSNGFQVSADPTQLVVRNDIGNVNFAYTPKNLSNTTVTGSAEIYAFTGGVGIRYVNGNWVNAGAEPFHAVDSDGEKYCNIMNIYYSTEYLLSQFPTSNSDNELYLYDFVENLLSIANSCLGGVNRFTCRLSEDNVLQIYDESRSSATKNFIKNPESAVLNLYGLKRDIKITENPQDPTQPFKTLYTEGSFVRNFSISSQLDKSFSTLISVGAQANGFAAGEDATMFSKWNRGLYDRIVPTKLDWTGNYTSVREQKIKRFKDAVTKYYYFLEHYSTLWNLSQNSDGIQILWCPSDYAANVKTQKDIFKWYSAIASMTSPESDVDYVNPTIGFLPINLSIDMDGISGMRIFDKLTVQTDFLPPGYDDTLDFIIKTLEHRIGLDNRWITHLETFAVPKLKDKKQAPGYFEALNIEEVLAAPLGAGVLAQPTSLTSNNPGASYFRINGSNLPLAQILGTGKKYGLDRTHNSLDELVQVVNQSAAPYFKQFFENILRDPLTRNGYVFQINTAYRPLGNNAVVTPNSRSSHMFGLAVDMEVYELLGNGGTSLYASNESVTSTRFARRYQDLNIVNNARKVGIGWAGPHSGYYLSNGTVRDNVHFAIDGLNAQHVYWRDSSFASSQYKENATGAWGGNAAYVNIVSSLDSYLINKADPTFLQNEYGPAGLSTNPRDYTWTKMVSRVAQRYTTLSGAQEASAQIYYNRLNTKDFLNVRVLTQYYDANDPNGRYWKNLNSGFSLLFEPQYNNLSISTDPSTFERDSTGKLTRNNYIPLFDFNQVNTTQFNNPLGIPGL